MSNMVVSMAGQLADSLGFNGVNGSELLSVLKATAFKGQVTDAQLTALLIVSQQYGLNPFTKEIYAFPDRQNGIVPVVGVDGWSRIINANPQFDGMDFAQDDESCTCVIYRKDRAHPIRVTEWMAECRRDGVGPWKSHPRRMLRHKAMIQCARIAFGFVGIYDEDEAQRIIEGEAREVPKLVEVEKLTDEQQAQLQDMIDANGRDKAKFLQWAKVESLQDIPASWFEKCRTLLSQRKPDQGGDNA